MTAPSRVLARAARQLADQQSQRIAAAAGSGAFVATVTTVTAGAAGDGRALVKVTYFGKEALTAGYAAAYTPAVGDRVLCLPVDSQPIVLCRIVGAP